jgi:DNA-binding response OmpR family regulator
MKVMAGWWLEWDRQGRLERAAIEGTLRVGRGSAMDVVLDDPYVSRSHCTISLVDGKPFVDARHSLNRVSVGGRELEAASLGSGDTFVIGRTRLQVYFGVAAATDDTRMLPQEGRELVLRRSTRELVDSEGTLIAQFSSAEFAAFEAVARKHPDAAHHSELGRAVWGELGYDQYQIHRLLQRIRQRLGDRAELLQNVRGAGYRLKARVDIR